MSWLKKLFPKGMKRDEVLARLKMLIHKLNVIQKEYDKKSQSFRKKAEILYRRGNKTHSKMMLLRSKDMENKSIKFTNLLIKLDNYASLIQQGQIGKEISSMFGLVADQFELDAEQVNPENAAEQEDRIQQSAMQIEQGTDLLSGDLESELGIDMDDEFAQFEGELLAKDAGELPQTPGEDSYDGVNIIDEDEEYDGAESKESVVKELEKLKEDLR